MRQFLLIIFIIISETLRAQPGQVLDSLKKRLSDAHNDTVKIKLLHALAYANLQINSDRAKEYGNQEEALAKKLNDKKAIATASYMIGNIFSIQGHIPEALKKMEESLRLFKELRDEYGIASSFSAIGNIYDEQDNYPEALKNNFSALTVYEKIGDSERMCSADNNIGTIYLNQKKYEDALTYYRLALTIAKKNDLKKEAAALMQNMAKVFMNQSKYNEALEYASQAMENSSAIANKYLVATCYQTIGSIYHVQKKYGLALRNCFTAVKILTDAGFNSHLADAFAEIGSIYYDQKEFIKAKEYFGKELSVAQDLGSLDVIRDANESLSKTYKNLGNMRKAFDAYKAYIIARDSLNSESNAEKEAIAAMQYDFDKKEASMTAEHQKKDAVTKIKMQQKDMMIAGMALGFSLLALLGWLLFRHRKLQINHRLVELEQNQLRAQMNPHFIFNCLNSIQHFVVVNDVIKANKYLSGFALLMRQTLENSKSGHITLRNEIEYLKNYLSLEWMLFEDKFSYEITCDESVNVYTAEIPAMIIQPFVENAIRHGLYFLNSRPGKLHVHFYIQSRHLCCSVDDNGIGRDESKKLKRETVLPHESHGMELTRQRLALVSRGNGVDYQITIADKKDRMATPAGTTVTIKFPTTI